MYSGSIFITLFLNYHSLALAIVAFVAALVALVAKGKTLSRPWKLGLGIALAVLAAYFLFVICALVAFACL